MEGSTPCTPDSDAANVSRESETMHSAQTPASGSNSSSFVNEAPSPLGHLDPHRLRDMVVDKQTACPAPIESPYKQPYWTPSPVGPSPSPSTSNIRSVPTNPSPSTTPIMQPPRLLGTMRDPTLLSPSGARTPVQQQPMGMCLPGRSPMGSPSAMHPPPSPFIGRPSSNASGSPYMQPPQTPIHYQASLQSPAGVMPPGHVPPSSPCAPYPSRMPTMCPPQQQYPCHAQMQQPQWAGQQPQQHFIGQPQMVAPSGPLQRVMVQRVAYPGYPPGMSQLQSPSNQQTPPSPAVYPGASGAPGTPAPRGAMYAPPPVAVSQQSPGAQSAQYPPPSYYQAKGQQQSPYPPTQPPVYRQQPPPPQSVPVRTYLGNQPSPMSASPAYPMYPAPNSAAANQQQNLQPQQYSPVARYPATAAVAPPGAAVQSQAPGAAINPCYPGPSGHDMRSPQLMSPTQAPVPGAVPAAAAAGGGLAPPMVNNTPLQRGIPNIEMQANGAPAVASQHMRMVQQTTPFYGHDPNVAGSVQSDMCLVGCFFVVIEHEKVLVDRLDVQEMGAVVRLHGGEIEFGVRAYNNVNSDRVTHVICESMRHQLVQQALKGRKRCVTLQWLNDVLTKKHLEAPWRVFHLPTFWTDNHRPAAGKLIAINGFNESEHCGVRMMITAIGARYTPHLTTHNHYLITKTCEGEKVERCRKMGIPVVTYQWLVEIYLGIKNAVIENENYGPLPGMISDTNTTPYNMEHYSEACKQLLVAWKTPILFTNEQWQRALEVKRTVENDENIFPNKRLRMTTPPPTDEEIETRRTEIGTLKEVPIVCFSGFTPDEKDALGRKVRFLGGMVTETVQECTHLVVLNLWRTMKLLEAIALGKNVVGANWITDGYRCRVIPDSLDYFVHDEENEKVFGYNLKYSILRARYRKLFQDVTFYLTPSVEPSYEELSSLIELAGGIVLREKPQPQYVIQCVETESLLLLIGNDSDVHLLQYLTDCGMPVYNVEIILTGILRQKLENSPLYRVAPIRPPLQPNPLAVQPHPTRNNAQNASQRVIA